MAVANPNSFDFYRRGQPCAFLKSKVNNKTFDYYRRLQPLGGEVLTTLVKDMLRGGMIIPFTR